MKCLETESLISYAYRLMDEPAASEVRVHLGECPRCRGIVEQYGRLDAVLGEWKTAEPTAAFDARVRQAVEAQQAGRAARWGWGWSWARGLALASLGILMIAGGVWLAQGRRRVTNLSQVAVRQPRPTVSAQNPVPMAGLRSPGIKPHADVRPSEATAETQSASSSLNEDKDAQALEDYDLAANFELLSEIPKGERRVVN
jgi:Zn-finger nucleic acid-binding protein